MNKITLDDNIPILTRNVHDDVSIFPSLFTYDTSCTYYKNIDILTQND